MEVLKLIIKERRKVINVVNSYKKVYKNLKNIFV